VLQNAVKTLYHQFHFISFHQVRFLVGKRAQFGAMYKNLQHHKSNLGSVRVLTHVMAHH
jgi:hypothetical protein